jgi:hypothetical protein
MRWSVLGLMALGASPLGFSAGFRTTQAYYPYQYAAKIVCGRPAELAKLAPQQYATVINVHNPGDSITLVIKKIALSAPPGRQHPGKVIPLAVDTLRGDEALNVDCADVAKRTGLGAASFEGFVVLKSQRSLDVTAVYAVPGGIDVEQIRERTGH